MTNRISIRKIGRLAGSGRFTSVKNARRRSKTAIVETIKVPIKRRQGKS